VRPGDEVTIQPSGQSARVSRIVTWDGDLAEAQAPLSVTLTLDRELDISRGDLITHTQSLATVVKSFQTALVWMDQLPLELNRRYLLKHTSHTVPAVVSAIDHRTDIGTLRHESASTLEMNGIGVVSIDLLRPIAIDTYSENRNTGAFILIDPATNRTVAAGMVTEISTALNQNRDSSELFEEPITAEERAFRWGHRAGVLKLSGPAAQINRIERSLFLDGVITSRIDLQSILFEEHPKLLTSLTELQTRSGFLVLQIDSVETDNLTASAEGVEISIDAADYGAVITGVHNLLTQVGFLLSPAKGSKQ
jgi:selenocysteine-specific translation elongation factor